MSMVSTDPIADMLTRIRNAVAVGKNEINLPHSKMKQTIAEQLKKAGYLDAVKVIEGKPRATLHITINEPGENSVITELVRISKPSRRVYAKAAEIPRVKSGRGIVLVSTSKGVMTGDEAKRLSLGGELICKIY